MNGRHAIQLTAAILTAAPLVAIAQQADSTCSTTFTVRSDTTSSTPAHLVARDTLITLDIGDRTWQRESVTVGVAFGAAGTAGARHAPWRACIGVSALLGHVTANLHNVRGRIHFRVDPAALDSIGRRSASPVVPPRR